MSVMTIPPPPRGYAVPSDPGTARYAAPPVSFATAVRRGLTVWTTRGRASRSEFWWFALVLAVVYAAVLSVVGLVLTSIDLGGASYAVFLVQPTVWLLFLPFVANVAVRRYHDSGRSGALLALHLAAYPVSVVITIASVIAVIAGVNEDSPPLVVVALVGNLAALALSSVSAIWMLVTLCRPGQDGPNRFDAPAVPMMWQPPQPPSTEPADDSVGPAPVQSTGQASTA
jgi:uncharacterized membrane protein YhaH (DUF805 family)